jgi:hypothetical protein
MTGLEFIKVVAASGGVGSILFLSRRAFRGIEEKVNLIYAERTSPDADVRAKCMIKQSYYEEPGVAQIKDGTLTIIGVAFAEIQVPLHQVRLVGFRRKNIVGRSGWWMKSIFTLDTPKTTGLKLGFSDPEPWIPFFQGK